METAEQLRDRLMLRFPGAQVTFVSNLSPSAQHSLLVDPGHARDIATFLRDDEALRLDYCSNATGIDWPDREIVETVKANSTAADGSVQEVEQKTKRIEPGCLEVVYHLYSMARKQGPVVLRVRTANRTDQVELPSLTPVWRSCEFQEREIFDLFGVVFEGHPDLRRILMWDEFKDHPMRKDYTEPDDYEWEPTPHGEVLAKAKKHYPEATSALASATAVASPAPTEGPKP
jgi:NADH-quinone oxidoreductase subunit C